MLAEWPMSILWQEFVAVEILSRRLPTSYQEHVVTPETSRVRNNENSVDAHGEGHPPDIYRMSEGGVIPFPPHQYVRQAGS